MGLEKINLNIKTHYKFQILKNLRQFFACFFHLKCYGISMCGGKVIGLVSNSTRSKDSIMIIFWDSLDCDIGCSIFCKVYCELNIYPFGNFLFGV